MKMLIVLGLLINLGFAEDPLPESPKPQTGHTILKLSPFILDISMTAWDAGYSSSHIGTGCREADPLLGHNPSSGRYWGQMMGTTITLDFIAWKLRHRHPRWAYALVLGDTGTHAAGIIKSYINCGPPPATQTIAIPGYRDPVIVSVGPG